MSTTYESILILGCEAEFKKIERMETRFREDTGEAYEKAFFDHYDLVVGDKILCSVPERWSAEEWADANAQFKVFRTCMDEVFVGIRISFLNSPGSKMISLAEIDSGQVAGLHGYLGTVPTLWLIQDVS